MLRQDVLNGSLSASELIALSPEQLASPDLREQRLKIIDDDIESRRLDWVDAKREQIQLNNGLDPRNKWVFEEKPPSDND